VVVSAVLALLCFDLPYRLALVVAVVGALAAGMASDELAARATLRGIRARKDKAKAEARAISESQPEPQTGDRA
jgi:hypothetical protein